MVRIMSVEAPPEGKEGSYFVCEFPHYAEYVRVSEDVLLRDCDTGAVATGTIVDIHDV